MLKRTFIHAPSVGSRTERWLWESGINDWEAFSGRLEIPGIGPTVRARIEAALARGSRALEVHDAAHFQATLPSREAWRIYGEFRGSTRYLDIETAGLSWHDDRITVIGVSDGINSKAYVAGRDLDRFEEALRGAAVLVTFNGKSFDVPFIRRQFPSARLPRAHIDLRHVFRALGLRGGLKKIEREIGVDRGDLSGVDGAYAVALWQRHERGDSRALAALVRYNLEDVVNLRYLMEWAYNRSMETCGAPGPRLTVTPHDPPALDYDRDILREIAAELAARSSW
jgi:uncharacterized protein